MFLLQAPEVRDLDVFTTMPEHFRRRERSDWADANRGGTITDSFLEGPVLDEAGHLYVTDIPWGRIFRIDAQGAWSLAADYFTRDRSQPYWRGPQSPLSGGRKR